MVNTKIKYNLEDVNYDIVECPNKRFTAEAKDKLEEAGKFAEKMRQKYYGEYAGNS